MAAQVEFVRSLAIVKADQTLEVFVLRLGYLVDELDNLVPSKKKS
jgi:hypothetical protein